MTSQYERELRHVLAGIPTGVEAVIKSCTVEEKERMRLVLQRPFLVVRAAGSGIEGSGDLLALRGDISFPIEVKTTKSKKIYFSGRTLDQYNALAYEGERCGLMPLYAHRLKGVRGDSWRIFVLNLNAGRTIRSCTTHPKPTKNTKGKSIHRLGPRHASQ